MQAEKRRQDIVDAGMKLFIQKGFEKVSVDDICRKLDISKPTLYKYVQKKEMILSYYYQQKSVDCLPEVYDYLAQNRPGRALQHLFTSLHEVAATMGPELYAAYRIYTLTDPDYLSVHSRPQVKVLETCLEGLQHKHYIHASSSPHKLAVMLMDLNEGLSLTWASSKGSFDLAAVFQSYTRSMLGVIVPEGSKPAPSDPKKSSSQPPNS